MEPAPWCGHSSTLKNKQTSLLSAANKCQYSFSARGETLCQPFPFLWLDFFFSGLSLHRSYACCHKCRVYICKFAVIPRKQFPTTPGSDDLFTSSSVTIPHAWEMLGIEVWIRCHTKGWAVWNLYSLFADKLWVSLLNAIFHEKKLLWWELGDMLMYECSNKLLGVVLIICLF